MNMFKRPALALAFSLCSLASGANSLTDYPAAKPGDVGYIAEDPRLAKLVGKPAPKITLRSIDGNKIDVAKNYGRRPVYLKLWATYCIPCRAQMPGLEKIYQQYGNQMQIVAVNAGIGDDPAKVRAFAAKADIHLPIAIDDGSLIEWLKVDSTPAHLLIGIDGRVAYAGHQDGIELDAALKRVLATTRPTTRIETSNSETVAMLKPGDLVPALELRGPDNSPVKLTATGHPRAVLFTASWCESYLKNIEPNTADACRHARQQVDELSQNASVEWFGVVTHLWTKPKALASYQIRIPMAVDTEGQAFRTFGIHNFPAVALINADGRLFRIVDLTENDLMAAIASWKPVAGH
jgi:thiol-disulfide isomerase/thioredoxin